jgi:hypothetical protein
MTTLPMIDDFANRELSIEELEAIAAGWPGWVHSAVKWVKNEAIAVEHWAESPSGQSTLLNVGANVLNHFLHIW